MKKMFMIFLLIVFLGLIGFGLFSNNQSKQNNNEYLRIHIRANSNSVEDQNVKYQIKARVVEYLTPLLCEATTKIKAVQIIENNKQTIINLANESLKNNGFNYTSNLKINNEYFPVRSYNDFTLDSGFYDAVIIELGEAKGDNWWCVVYPPLCFTDYSYGKNVVYKSKLLEIINNFFNK